VRGAAIALLSAALAAGCVTRRVEAPAPAAAPGPAEPEGADAPADPVAAMAGLDLRIECDRARLQVPERLRSEVRDRQKRAEPPFLVTVRRMNVVTREDLPVVEIGGEDFSVVAEGGVRTTRTEGGVSVVEGPFQAVILRNGRMLRK
jgi:hypothetical protein